MMMMMTMKILSIVLFVTSMGFSQETQPIISYESGSLQRVEEMKPEEITELQKAGEAIKKAQINYEQVRSKIFRQHNMTDETWMEWRTWTEVNGKFLLHYYQSYMGNFSFTKVQ